MPSSFPGMDTLDAFLRLHYAARNAAWLRHALYAIRDGAALDETSARAPEPWAAQDLLAAPVAEWLALGAPIGAREVAGSAEASAYIARCRRWLESDPAHSVLGWADPDYPSLLRDAPSPPSALFVDGRSDRLWWPQIAVVGSRTPTPAGRERAARWAQAFAEAGYVVTSGLAAGVDAAAHTAALGVAAARDGAGTIAVTGTGPDRCFPATHRSLHTAIASGGCVVTEHAPGTEARPEHFPSRNRIIAGLSLATVVIEAAQRSGALITARLAAEAGREVFALPGAPENLKARGCHRLIRDGAQLVDEPEQVLAAIARGAAGVAERLRQVLRSFSADSTKASPRAAPTTPESEKPRASVDHGVLAALGTEGASIDTLMIRTGLTSAAIAPILLAMELDGRVTQQHGVYLPYGSAPPTRAECQRRR